MRQAAVARVFARWHDGCFARALVANTSTLRFASRLAGALLCSLRRAAAGDLMMREARFPIALERKVRPRVVNADADAAAHARARRAAGFARRVAGAAAGPEPVRRRARPDRHGRRHGCGVRGDRRRPRLPRHAVRRAQRDHGADADRGDARRRRPRTVPGRLPRCRRPVGQRRQRIQQRRMDDAVRVRGALRRPPRGGLHVPDQRLRPGRRRRVDRSGDEPDHRPLQRRRRGDVRGRRTAPTRSRSTPAGLIRRTP